MGCGNATSLDTSKPPNLVMARHGVWLGTAFGSETERDKGSIVGGAALRSASRGCRVQWDRGQRVPHRELEVAKRELRPLLNALRFIESSNRVNCPDGDAGSSIGPLQISEEYHRDAWGHRAGRWTACRELAHAEDTVVRYWLRYCPGAIRAHDWELLAKFHNGGPRGTKHSKTRAYWRKVVRHLAAQQPLGLSGDVPHIPPPASWDLPRGGPCSGVLCVLRRFWRWRRTNVRRPRRRPRCPLALPFLNTMALDGDADVAHPADELCGLTECASPVASPARATRSATAPPAATPTAVAGCTQTPTPQPQCPCAKEGACGDTEGAAEEGCVAEARAGAGWLLWDSDLAWTVEHHEDFFTPAASLDVQDSVREHRGAAVAADVADKLASLDIGKLVHGMKRAEGKNGAIRPTGGTLTGSREGEALPSPAALPHAQSLHSTPVPWAGAVRAVQAAQGALGAQGARAARPAWAARHGAWHAAAGPSAADKVEAWVHAHGSRGTSGGAAAASPTLIC
ncbi:unnamed protein product [Closterium sp. NIES-64]|nr:unnamed protein product [Closterium sp. NIES-64]